MKYKELISKIALFVGIIIIFILLILLYAWINTEYSIGFPCTLNKVFGIYCPGCGLTRAGISLLKLDFYQAFRYNAFSLILIPGVFIGNISILYEIIFNKKSFVSKIPIPIWLVLIISFIGYGIIRNFIPILQPIAL